MPTEFAGVGAFSGRHVLAELDGVAPERLDDEQFLRTTLAGALTSAGASVREVVAHRFEPQGVTVLALLAESHASVHTYPEIGALFVDVFTCGDRADPEQAVRLLAAALGTDSVSMTTVQRGREAATAGK
ncbi:adenosylmethionine decarboxylase [Prauserella cavernicola]|uniref:S-adenosylmethionine decarboxylase proenzyme n=1 Tax=Prauserella cavernicola TaxID=2800127 RepID=A0A934R0L9_9PSEU|nr:adenosylmethionine decarboxylase [Prauserella cavernicola]MBK1788663.1 adenosylmethionine decarboxylase [Prauserella cavernicola]